MARTEPYSDPTEAVEAYLGADDEVVRAAAARCLGRLGGDAAADALVRALLDEDPDVRVDAMAGLEACARLQDAGAILESLQGDPVPEVKVAAIQTLGRLKAVEALPLLRALVRGRCEDEIAWDDEDSVWDDWLDCQIVAIKALKDFEAIDAIPDLLAAREDEFGQNLDLPIFDTLAGLGERGISTLYGLIQHPDQRTRRCAMKSLSTAAPEKLLALSGALLADASPAVRSIMIDALGADDPAVETLILHDPDVDVRSAAIAAYIPPRSDLLCRTLNDPSPRIVVEILDRMSDGQIVPDVPDLGDNLTVWAKSTDPLLASAAIKLAAIVIPDRASGFLATLAEDDQRAIQIRLAAIAALVDLPPDDDETLLGPLPELSLDRVRQVRLAALSALSRLSVLCADARSSVARDLLCQLALGEVAPEQLQLPEGSSQIDPASDPSASKSDEPGADLIEISRDGQIVSRSKAEPEDEPFPGSTLDAIQMPSTARPVSKDVLDLARKKRKRVPVDGPDDFAEELRCMAAEFFPLLSETQPNRALDKLILDEDPEVVAAILTRLSKAYKQAKLTEDQMIFIVVKLRDENSLVRQAACQVLVNDPKHRMHVASLVQDIEPDIRAMAYAALAETDPTAAVPGLVDTSPAVRRATLAALIDGASPGDAQRYLRTLAASENGDTLRGPDRQNVMLGEVAAQIVCQERDLSRVELLCLFDLLGEAP